jgi:hypothetical protein
VLLLVGVSERQKENQLYTLADEENEAQNSGNIRIDMFALIGITPHEK